jgi:hypothetical protein
LILQAEGTFQPLSETAQALLRRLARLAAGCAKEEDAECFIISAADFAAVDDAIENNDAYHGIKGYYLDKLRSTFLPATSRFHVHMPTEIHEEIISAFDDCVREGLQFLKSKREYQNDAELIQRVVQDIRNTRSSIILAGRQRKDGYKDPDGSWRYRDQKNRTAKVVLEVSFCQKGSNLGSVLKQYFQDMATCPKTVIAVDIDYSPRKETDSGAAISPSANVTALPTSAAAPPLSTVVSSSSIVPPTQAASHLTSRLLRPAYLFICRADSSNSSTIPVEELGELEQLASVPSNGLELSLADFVPASVVTDYPSLTSIKFSIPYTLLRDSLRYGEIEYDTRKREEAQQRQESVPKKAIIPGKLILPKRLRSPSLEEDSDAVLDEEDKYAPRNSKKARNASIIR